MDLKEYASYDGLGLAELVRKRDVTPKELAATAARAIEAVNPQVNAVVETYDDRIGGLDDTSLGDGPFRGVPFLIKDVGGHERGRRIENGSRLCQGMIGIGDSNVIKLLRASGVNVLGRSNAPEYSIAGTTENALYGNTSTPWRQGYSAGGSTGGGAAAVAAGMVPITLGSQTGGSTIRPGSYCGVFALKPTHGLISRHGMLQLSRSLDHVGLFARTIEDLALVLEEVAGHDERDADTHLGRGLDDCSFTTVEYGDVPVFVEAGYFAPGIQRDCVIVGELGTLAADFGTSEVRWLANRHVQTSAGWQAREGAVEGFKASGPEPLRHELERFLGSVAGHGQPAVDVPAGLAALRTVEAAQRSSSLGRRVTLAELA